MKNKTKVLFLLISLWISVGLYATPISREQAQKRAEQYLQNRKGSRKLAAVSNGRKLAPRKAAGAKQEETSLYYVFNRGNQEGYVIVPGDDMIDGVLGYTDEGEFDYQEIPPAMQEWLDDYADYISYLQSEPNAAPKKLPKHAAIAPMTTTKWNQGAPFNQSCPMYFNLGRSVTGCVATALAQALYYNHEKSVAETQETIPSYNLTSDQYGTMTVASVPKGSPIDWGNMKDTYKKDGSDATAKQKKAVADLMFYCGACIKMKYTNKSSSGSTSNLPDAMRKYFGYGSSVKYISRKNYTEDNWDQTIYNELAHERVVILRGSKESGGGHAFVCDGYDGNTCYHINWGWGGSSDGYFLMSSLNPKQSGIGGHPDDPSGYTGGQGAVIGIEPTDYLNNPITFANSVVKSVCVSRWDTNGDGKLSYGEAAAITDLGDAFTGIRVQNFEELYYFTSLTTIADDAFSGCTSLTSIKFPKSIKKVGKRAFAGCIKLNSLTWSDNIISIGDSAFYGCRTLPTITLPTALNSIGASAFQNCVAITALDVPISVESVGERAYAGCTKLKTVAVKNPFPQSLTLGPNVFEDTNLSTATLEILHGTRDYFSTANQWKEFGTLRELHNLAQGKFIELTTNKDLYLYNIGTGLFLTCGEAYGTQAIVGEQPVRFQLRHDSGMPEGTYYLYTDENENENAHWLFRTTKDKKVGTGISCCFLDGKSLTEDSYWKFESIGNNQYTLQIPSTASDYKKGQYLGTQQDHENNYVLPTNGIFSDVSYESHPRNCQWALVAYDAATIEQYEATKVLDKLLTMAANKKLSVAAEQAVYDNMESSLDEILAAQMTLRKKLNLVIFKDPALKAVAIENWDNDGDGEFTYPELANVTTIGDLLQGNTSLTTLEDLQYLTGLSTISTKAFQGCSKLKTVCLPERLLSIESSAFENCTALENITLPASVGSIAESAFRNCTSLKSVTVSAQQPSDIKLGSIVFSSTYVRKATLYVPFGTKSLYEAASTWKTFGEIKEIRSHQLPPFSPLEANVPGYLYNLGSHLYLSRGEAWGTQSVVDTEGLAYEFKQVAKMPEGVYYLYSSGAKPYLFRTSTDDTVGEGVKACFSDGASDKTSVSTWQVAYVNGTDNKVFTLQVPSSDNTYVKTDYLGVNTNHASSFTSSTFGAYWDIKLTDGEENCQWAFVKKADADSLAQLNKLGDELIRLLERAEAKALDVAAERSVCDNPAATADELAAAIASLQNKLGYIKFIDPEFELACLNEWDADNDGFLSKEEAAAVKTTGTPFYGASSISCMDEFRYFTGLTELPTNFFRGCSSLVSVYIPAHVTKIGNTAFTNATSLKYIALMSEDGVVTAPSGTLPKDLTIFVPQSLVTAYQNDERWGQATIKEYTGNPVVHADNMSRTYGASNPTFTFTVTGAPINGEPELTCEAKAQTAVGNYPITIALGTITTPDVQLEGATLTIEKAPLTIKARSYSRNYGEANPTFQVTYRSFKNNEKESVLLVPPTIECDATPESLVGDYEIRVFGAEAENYEITYESGILTVKAPAGVSGVTGEKTPAVIYDLTGRKVNKTQRGIFIIDGKKSVVTE